MQPDPTLNQAENRGFPWHLLWVVAALALAGVNLKDFYTSGRLASLIIVLAWLCWAFSWYAKPFRVRFGAKLSEALTAKPLNPRVPQALWTFVTFSAVLLMVSGVVLKFPNAA